MYERRTTFQINHFTPHFAKLLLAVVLLFSVVTVGCWSVRLLASSFAFFAWFCALQNANVLANALH
jgi:hypothetical protein